MTDALDRVVALPRLAPQPMSRPCKLCGSPAGFFDTVDFLKHCGHATQYQFGLAGIAVSYFRCAQCGFLFSPIFDDWPQDALARFVYNEDYIRVDPEYGGARADRLARTAARLLAGCESLRLLDYGGGTGRFTEQMRAAGFTRAEVYDPFSQPVRPKGQFDIITCFEVLEHALQPRATFDDVRAFLASDGLVIASESLQPLNIESVRGAWWYIAPRNGHVSTFTVAAMLAMSNGGVWHGNGWLWAWQAEMAGDGARIAQSIGPRALPLRLVAPVGEPSPDWHRIEAGPKGSFRWTGARHMSWQLAGPGSAAVSLHIDIPFMLESRPGFAAACGVEVNGTLTLCHPGATALRAEVTLSEGADTLEVTLCCPDLTVPAQDARLLGIALPT